MARAPVLPAPLESAHTSIPVLPAPLESVHTSIPVLPSLHPLINHLSALSLSEYSSHGWSSPPANAFFVRGPLYLDTKAKVPSGEPLLHPIAFDVLKSSSKISNIMAHPQCRVRTAVKAASRNGTAAADKGSGVQDPFVWVFNLQLPSKENHSLVMYFVSFEKPEKGSLMQRFLDGNDTFRSERLKFLTNIPQGPHLVKLAVGEKGAVCMIGKAFKCTYIKEKDYMEIDADIGSSMMASAAFQLCGRLTALATIDLAFVLEGRCRDELPERVVGAMRLEKLNFGHAWSLGKHVDECGGEKDMKPNACGEGFGCNEA